jgi:hypothetical protein
VGEPRFRIGLPFVPIVGAIGAGALVVMLLPAAVVSPLVLGIWALLFA